jgi:predicted 2-oxoglutarate/Fe(II)-dependent dioxygenase YbiX
MTETRQDAQWRPLYFPAVAERLIDKNDCERIIAAAHDLGFQEAKILNTEGEHSDSEIRSCEAVTLTGKAHPDVYDFVAKAITQVNNKQYRFGLMGLEPISVMRYTEGSFFREHSDLGYQYDYSAGRKISFVAQLSDGDSYQGGQLILFGEEEMPRTQGSTFIFPSWLPHRVEKLTGGVRYTLVGWAKGPPFN